MPDRALPMGYQSIGSQATTRNEGRLLAALYPADRPYFKQELPPQVLHDPSVPQGAKDVLRDALYVQDVTVMALLESAGLSSRNARGAGFYHAKRRSLTQLIVTGDTLERINPDFSITVFRRDKYVTVRDGEGRVVLHIARESIDPLTLDDDKFALSGLDRGELEELDPARRMMDLWTSVEWQVRSESWVLKQEINKNVIHEADEAISPFVSTAYELAGGDSYGRGLIEQNYGDLLTFDQLSRYMIDYAGMHSKMVPIINTHSHIKPQDLAQPSGVPIIGDVRDGQAKDIAFLQVNKGGDFAVVLQTMQTVGDRLGKSLMLESESVRDSERTTAFEVSNVTLRQTEGQLAAAFAAIADQNQGPTARRAMHQARKRKLIRNLPSGLADRVRLSVVTGPAALASEARATGAMTLVEVARSIGPEAMDYISFDVLFNMLARYRRTDEPGLIRSRDEVQQIRAQRAQQQLAMQAGEQAIASAGAIAENAASAQS